MPMDRDRYPDDWELTALSVKQSAAWKCQSCGRPCRQPKEDWHDFLFRQPWTIAEAIAAALHPQRYTLTTAHINHDPENPQAELRAWCAPCHARYDLKQIRRKRASDRKQKGSISFDLIIFDDVIKDLTHG